MEQYRKQNWKVEYEPGDCSITFSIKRRGGPRGPRKPKTEASAADKPKAKSGKKSAEAVAV